MFFQKKRSAIDWIVAGLGNPGRQYEGTRHNAGFDALDAASRKWGIPVRRAKFDALCGDGVVNGKRVLLLKPQTFMNLSGQSLIKCTDYYKIQAGCVLVLCDDVNLAPGTLRIRMQGSDGGHNGLKSLITFLGQDFVRIRIGVGNKPHPAYDMAAWVTGKPSAADREKISARFPHVAAAAELLMGSRAEEAMARYNGEGR